jgi:hypothetical protein
LRACGRLRGKLNIRTVHPPIARTAANGLTFEEIAPKNDHTPDSVRKLRVLAIERLRGELCTMDIL